MSTGATWPAARRAPLPELAKIPPGHIVGERRNQLAALLKRHYEERGVSTHALAAEIGRSQKFVCILLEEAGTATRPMGSGYLKGLPAAEWTPENRKAASEHHRRLCADLRRRYEEGVSEDRLANETGQSRDRIHRLLIEAGTTFRGPVITDYTAEGRQRRLIEEGARQWAYGQLARRYRHLFSELFADECARVYEILGMTYDPRGSTPSAKGIFGVHDEASTASEASTGR